MLSETLKRKEKLLLEELSGFSKLCIAYSGGVDSSLLVDFCINFSIPFIAVSVKSEFLSKNEESFINRIVKEKEIDHKWIELKLLNSQLIYSNPSLRCYYCKKYIFRSIKSFAEKNDIKTILEGSHADDSKEFRPGTKALIELDILSPLKQTGFTKDEIREMAREYGSEVWDKPSTPCLATRIPHDTQITEKKLSMIEESEEYLLNLGFKDVRVRFHDTLARIEFNITYISKFVNDEIRINIVSKFKEIGFRYVSVDIEGYRTGSMSQAQG